MQKSEYDYEDEDRSKERFSDEHMRPKQDNDVGNNNESVEQKMIL